MPIECGQCVGAAARNETRQLIVRKVRPALDFRSVPLSTKQIRKGHGIDQARLRSGLRFAYDCPLSPELIYVMSSKSRKRQLAKSAHPG